MTQKVGTDFDSFMMNAANMIAMRHGCSIDIDFQNRIINFDCKDDRSSTKCALELDEVLGRYIYDPMDELFNYFFTSL